MGADERHKSSLTERRFGFLLFTLRMAGVAINMKKQPKAHAVYNVYLVASYYITCLAIFMDYIRIRNDFDESMKNLRVFFGAGVVTWMHLCLRFYKDKLEHLVHLTDSFTWEDMPARDPSTGRVTMAGSVQRVQTVVKGLVLYMYVFHVVQTTMRMWANHDMVFTTWYPFDVSYSPVYEIVNVTQVNADVIGGGNMSSIHFSVHIKRYSHTEDGGINFLRNVIILHTPEERRSNHSSPSSGEYTAYVLITSVYIGFQGLFATLVCVACSQFEKLRANMSLIGDRRLNTVQGSGDGPGSERMLEQLKDCIRHHQNIILYIQELEKSLNPSLAGMFLFLLTAMCFIALSAVTSWGDHTDVSQAFFMYGLMMGNVFVFCWLGTALSDQAEAVGEAAWDSRWVGSALPFQRCLIFIIASANKEFKLTAGKFVPVSNNTMINMMNQTVSFFMFLLHMKNKNEGITHRP